MLKYSTIRKKRIFYKLVWLTFVIISSGLSFYLGLDVTKRYLNYEVITKIESKYEQPMLFPTVSFCPYVYKDFNNKSLNKIIKKCWFNLDRSCELNPNNYFERFHSFRGDCFRFNSGKNMSGQTIPFLYSTIGGKDDSFFLKLEKNLGLMVWIHQVSLPPRFASYNDHLGNMIYVSPYSKTQLIVNKLEEKKLGLPYNQCYDDLNLFSGNKTIINYITKSLNETYVQTNCLEICYDIFYINNDPCNCSNTSVNNVWQDCFINLEKSNKSGCIYNNKLDFFKESVLNKCKEYCPLECNSISYSVNFNILTGLEETMFTVYFASLKYTIISEMAKETEIYLISNVCGIFGLLFGFILLIKKQIDRFDLFEKNTTTISFTELVALASHFERNFQLV